MMMIFDNDNDSNDDDGLNQPGPQTSLLLQKVEFLWRKTGYRQIITISKAIIEKTITSKLSEKANLGDKLVPASGEDCRGPMFNPEKETNWNSKKAFSSTFQTL